jgi:Haem-binding domain
MRPRFVLFIVAIVLLIQLYRPAKTNPPINPAKSLAANAQLPPDVEQTLQHSCTDCHTNRTTWPKYSYVAPVSWIVIDDVNEGRRHLNFDEWGLYSVQKQQAKLNDICDEVNDGGMPLRQYTWMHHGTALDQQQRDSVCSWVRAEQQRIAARTGVAPPPPKRGGMQAK